MRSCLLLSYSQDTNTVVFQPFSCRCGFMFRMDVLLGKQNHCPSFSCLEHQSKFFSRIFLYFAANVKHQHYAASRIHGRDAVSADVQCLCLKKNKQTNRFLIRLFFHLDSGTLLYLLKNHVIDTFVWTFSF